MLILIYVILLLPWTQNKLQTIFIPKLNEQLPGYLSVQSIRMDGCFQINIREINWSNHSSMKEPFLSCTNASLQLNLLKFIRHQFPFTHVSIDSLWIDDRLLKQLSPNDLQNSSADQKMSSSWPIKDCDFQISNSTFISRNPEIFVQGGIRGINFSGKLHGSELKSGLVRIRELFVWQDSSIVSLGKLTGRLYLEKNTRHCQIELTHEQTSLYATFKLNENQRVTGKWRFLDCGHLIPALISSDTFIIDQLNAKGFISGVIDSLHTMTVIYPAASSLLIPDSLTCAGTLSPGRISEIYIRMPWLNGNMAFTGSLALNSNQTSNFTLTAEALSLSLLWQTIHRKKSPFTGQGMIQISGSGPGLDIRQWTGSGLLSIEDITYHQDKAASLAVRLLFCPDSLLLSARQGTTEVYGQLKTGMAVPEGFIQIQNLRTGLLAPWINLTGFQGGIHGRGKVKGSWENPIVHFQTYSSHLRYRFMKIDTFFMDLIYENNTIDLKTAELIAHSDTFINLAQARDPFVGNLKLGTHISGPVDHLHGDFHLRGHIDEWSGFHADTLSVQADIFKRTMSAMATIVSDSSKTSVQGKIGWRPLKGQLEMDVRHLTDSTSGLLTIRIDTIHGCRFQTGDSGLPVALFSSFCSALPPVEARLALHGNYRPFSKEPFGSINFRLTDLPLSDKEAGLASGYLHLNRDTTEFKAAVSCGSDSLLLHGNMLKNKKSFFETVPSIKARVAGHIRNVSPYIRFWTPNILMEGSMVTDFEITGPSDNLKFYGNLFLQDGYLKWSPQLEIADALTLTARFQGDSLNANLTGKIANQPFTLQSHSFHFLKSSPTWQIFWQSDSSQLYYQGFIDNNGWTGNFRASDFHLRLLQPMMPYLNHLNGRLNAQVSFQPNNSGTFDNGTVDIQELAFSLSQIPVHVSRGHLHSELNAHTVRIDSLSFHINDGHYNGKGEYAHRNFQFFAGTSHLKGGRSRFKKSGVYEILLDSLNMMLASNGIQHQLTGKLTLAESKFRQSIRLKDILAWIDRTRRPWKKPSDFQKNLQMNVRIRNSKPFWIDNNLARIKINSGLGVYGTLAQPYFMGNLTVKEGYVLYLDRKFEVRQGELTFSNPESPYPEVIFYGQKAFHPYETFSGKSYLISLNVSGPANRVQIQWQSEPYLPEADILALTTLGATRQELTRENSQRWGTQFTDVLQDRLALISSQQISTYTTKTLGNLFGLERVALEGNLFKFNKSWGPQLLASKKLSDRLILTYRTSVGQSNAQEVKLNYKLTKKFSLEGQTDQEGESGIDILYQLKF
ncbi:translocation/assembly module TamB domain-containing protein [bacterium]|nr:translocation/assembly module TamB domain-containing protein [bacterium]